MLMIVICICISGCMQNHGKSSKSNRSNTESVYSTDKMSAILILPEKTIKKSVSRIPFTLLLLNGGKTDVSIDKRMIWSFIVDIWVKLPDGEEIPITELKLCGGSPEMTDYIKLKPNDIYGTRIWIDLNDKKTDGLDKRLVKRTPGKYTFWFIYTNIGRKDKGIPAFGLTSNKVAVDIE